MQAVKRGKVEEVEKSGEIKLSAAAREYLQGITNKGKHVGSNKTIQNVASFVRGSYH